MMFRAISSYLLAFHFHLGDRMGLALRAASVLRQPAPSLSSGAPPMKTISRSVKRQRPSWLAVSSSW